MTPKILDRFFFRFTYFFYLNKIYATLFFHSIVCISHWVCFKWADENRLSRKKMRKKKLQPKTKPTKIKTIERKTQNEEEAGKKKTKICAVACTCVDCVLQKGLSTAHNLSLFYRLVSFLFDNSTLLYVSFFFLFFFILSVYGQFSWVFGCNLTLKLMYPFIRF